MPGTPRDGQTAGNEGFREAIDQWRTALRSEVKRSSSLPTAMFDACDPMLETRLAETAEAMLNRLQEPLPEVSDAQPEALAKRIEQVAPDELRSLPKRIAGATVELDVAADLAAEYLGILTDTCCVASGHAQSGAVHLLRRDFALGQECDLGQLTRLLAGRLPQVEGTPIDAVTEAALHDVCQRIHAALLLHLDTDHQRAGDPKTAKGTT